VDTIKIDAAAKPGKANVVAITESGDLTKYNAAKRALAEAICVDEVKDIRDKAKAMQVYAMQAKDRVLIDQATEIRLRAERRVGELLKETQRNKGARGEGRPKKGGSSVRPPKDGTPRLSDLGINKTQSSRWQKLADISNDQFEELLTHAQHKASAVVDKAQQPKLARSNPKRRRFEDASMPGVVPDGRGKKPTSDGARFGPKSEQAHEVVAADEKIGILREFAQFVINVARNVSIDPKDHDQWRSLRERANAVLRSGATL
jgi:hypothetical protein